MPPSCGVVSSTRFAIPGSATSHLLLVLLYFKILLFATPVSSTLFRFPRSAAVILSVALVSALALVKYKFVVPSVISSVVPVSPLSTAGV